MKCIITATTAVLASGNCWLAQGFENFQFQPSACICAYVVHQQAPSGVMSPCALISCYLWHFNGLFRALAALLWRV
jgi:hypothetical protein